MPKFVGKPNSNKIKKFNKPKKASELIRGKIAAYYDERKSKSEIARIVKLPRSTVCDIINVYVTTGDIKRKTGSGRKRKTSGRQDRAIVKIAKQDPFCSSRSMSNKAKIDHNIEVSRKTIERRLKEAGLNSYVAKKKPFISALNIKKRLDFALSHKDWTVDQWKRILWTDETFFNLSYHGRQFVWRPKGKEYDRKYIKPTFKHGGGKIMVWGCFSSNGVGDLYKIDGTMV